MSETKASQVKSFLAAANMDPDQIDIEACVENLLEEMRRGLAGEPSSLAMIPTYLNCEEDVPTGKPVIVMDAGGTNVRVCVVEFASDGSATISDFAKYRMPGIDRELSADEFYGELAGFLSPVIAKSDRIGFCFSYPSEISPEKDGKLLRWTKEVKVPEVEGTYIGAGLIEHLGEKGVERKKIVLLNDTVATLLAGKAVGDTYGCADYIGFILGTGTNTAYVEKNVNIRKLSGLPGDGRMPINMESGNFNKAPMSYIDDRFDATTVNPGCQRFEKMISGAYLGPLALQVLKAAAREQLFSAE
ncbi:MAG: hexokinase, partial [Lentisphaerae bacterium]